MRIKRLILVLACAGAFFFPLPAATPAEPDLNSRTANLNVLFLGADRSRLLMASVFSINHQDGFRAGALFFPVETLLPDGEGGITLAEIFRRDGTAALASALEQRLQVDITYFVRIDRRVLLRAATFLDPLRLDGREVPLADLFTLEVTPGDGFILGQLMNQFARPSVYFWHLPALVLASRGDLETDFPPTADNLWLHYRLARGVDTGYIPKQVAPGRAVPWRNDTAWQVEEEIWREGIYRLTASPAKQAVKKEKARFSPRPFPQLLLYDLLPLLGLHYLNA